MSDSEDDYMSDKLLVGCETNDVRPGLLFNKTQKREHEIHKHQLEARLKKSKSYSEQESDAREKGLQTAISTENKGFKLLEKMGFKPGSSLGKSESGLKEPISIKLKPTKTGVGREQHLEKQRDLYKSIKDDNLRFKESAYRKQTSEKRLNNSLQKDYYKAQRICEEMDFRNKVEVPQFPFFWTKRTRDKIKERAEKKDEESDKTEGDSEEGEEEDEEEEETEIIDDDKLQAMLTYLHQTYFYCIYCGVLATSSEDLNSFCPGISRSDHDDSD